MPSRSRHSPRARLPAAYRHAICTLLGFLVIACTSVSDRPNAREATGANSSPDVSPTSPGTGPEGAGDAAPITQSQVPGALVGAAEGAFLGGVYGIQCGTGLVVCSPVLAVVGAVAGAVHGAKVERHGSAKSYANYRNEAKGGDDSIAAAAPFSDRHKLAGSFRGYGPLPPGELYVDTTSVHMADGRHRRTAYMVVNVDSTIEPSGATSGRSYAAQAVVDCSTSDFSIYWWRFFSDPNAMGEMGEAQVFRPPLLVEDNIYNPDNVLRTAADIACKS